MKSCTRPFFPLMKHLYARLGEGNPKSVLDMLIDSGVIGGIGFFSSLIAALATNSGLPSTLSLYAAGLAFGMAFLTQFGSERRIKMAKKEIV